MKSRQVQVIPQSQQMANNLQRQGWSNAVVTVPTSCWLAGTLLTRIHH